MFKEERKERSYLLDEIFNSRNTLTAQQAKTLIGQVKSKNYLGARKGLNKLMNVEIYTEMQVSEKLC